ncbi:MULTISPECIES: hypothetical protein [unclassified Blastomonas]|uniref:hypothetical protein n=1 Tax=unclassified Blastomonas TaxID=2626550 RepID=UPI0008242B1A|nr:MULTISPECIES: hypothetical protein [unclassified Blastomonas]
MVRFPVTAAVRSNAGDVPAPETPSNTIWIFDHFGYWVSLGHGPLELPGDNLSLGLHIASMINDAYERGRADAQMAVREALGMEA